MDTTIVNLIFIIKQ